MQWILLAPHRLETHQSTHQLSPSTLNTTALYHFNPKLVQYLIQESEERLVTKTNRPPQLLFHTLRKTMFKVVVFQFCLRSHLFYTFKIIFHIKLESSSTGSSFPAVTPKPVPLAVVSLCSR